MVTYAVRLEWPPEWSPDLDADELLSRLVGHEPVVAAGRILLDGYATPWTVTVCAEGTTPRIAAQRALATVEPLIGTRVSGFRVESSDGCAQLADLRDSVPDLVPDDVVEAMIREHLSDPLERLEARPDFPAVVIETRHGVLRDLDEVRDWIERRRRDPS
ncbi:hypothetical protein [Nocardioides sp. CFH 31398]|uniref:hypothetical protein n=1 Tax=Nocardioides sp. CFH 31398 TaxID=2919579 RepID=UPI001F06E32E|nr:hypothetical protein [Nocardioides sp. CFH 31398]MCH1865278.1 hypothetical protein [Nocardioides sp. CFH 31398]